MEKLNIIENEVHELEKWLHEKQKVIASIAPAYVAEFGDKRFKAIGALKALGFYGVEETISVLPEIVGKRTEARKLGRKYHIFNSCPTIWNLIETHYPKVREHLLVSPSPMMLHGERLKQKYPDAKVVFIGPCLAKKWEQERFYNEKRVDMVLTFEEIRHILYKHGIDVEMQEEGELLSHPPSWCMLGLLVYYKSGLSDVVKFLDNFHTEKKDINGMELLACKGGCISGPGMTNSKTFDEKLEIIRNGLGR